jgi:small nuclear ribonucleoprotein (snRNP)-like protein
MKEKIERPLDLLNALKGKEVIIVTKNTKEIKAELVAFDIHINLVIEKAGHLRFIRGDEVMSVEELNGS